MTIMKMKTLRCGITGMLIGLSVLAALSVLAVRLRADTVKRFDTFGELPITTVEPQGWLRLMLENQRDGLTGHMDKASGFPFNSDEWYTSPFPDSKCWTGYAEWGMLLDGVIRCGYLLDDDGIISTTRKYINYTLNHPAENGILGPNWNDWTEIGPHHFSGGRYITYHFFHVLMNEFSATGDERILSAMRDHYLRVPPRQHAVHQGIGNIEEICWLYGLTGDKRILEKGLEAWACVNQTKYSHYRNFDMPLDVLLSDKKATQHGLTYMDGIRAPILLYQYTGDEKLLDAALNGFRKLDRDHMLIDGCPSSNECLAGKNPRTLHETCVVPAYAWVAGYLLMITGDSEWADKIERCVFNAGMGSITKDFKSLQYYSGPNQVISTSKSSHNHQAGRERMQFRPGHGTQCCPASVHSFLPSFVSRMWLEDRNGGLVAAFYGPSKIATKVGDRDQEVTIVEKTEYPFSETVEFEIQSQENVRFPLWLRIPGWCQEAVVAINGEPVDIETKAGSFVKLEREYAPQDKIVLTLPMELKLSYWQEGGIGIERGPLAYSLLIKEDRTVDKDAILRGKVKPHRNFPAWNIRPASPWNYALHVSYNQAELEEQVEVVQRPMVKNPWAIGASPVQLKVPACRLPDWTLEDDIRTPRLPSPVEPSEKIEKITLVPQGSTCIRLTIFPDCRYKWGKVACDRICNEDGS